MSGNLGGSGGTRDPFVSIFAFFVDAFRCCRIACAEGRTGGLRRAARHPTRSSCGRPAGLVYSGATLYCHSLLAHNSSSQQPYLPGPPATQAKQTENQHCAWRTYRPPRVDALCEAFRASPRTRSTLNFHKIQEVDTKLEGCVKKETFLCSSFVSAVPAPPPSICYWRTRATFIHSRSSLSLRLTAPQLACHSTVSRRVILSPCPLTVSIHPPPRLPSQLAPPPNCVCPASSHSLPLSLPIKTPSRRGNSFSRSSRSSPGAPPPSPPHRVVRR